VRAPLIAMVGQDHRATVFLREIPSSRMIACTGQPSARCSRRIPAKPPHRNVHDKEPQRTHGYAHINSF
jgi:hypothetical protein